MKLYQFVLFVFLFTLNFHLNAQVFGNNSSKIQWKEIDSKNVRVIFPKGASNEAQRIANIVNYIHKYSAKSIGNQTKKIDIILQTEQVVSNGFVTLSPFRSEFFSTSPQDFSALGSTEWLDLLAIHEYRHVLQYTNANRGATKVFHYLAGENGWSLALNLSIPNWYLEGDAVLSETLLSKNGRGRNPNFFKEQRALLLNKSSKPYPYMKARNGSLKDIVPNHYRLGFVLNNYIRNNYKTETSSKILADAGSYTIPFYPFSSATKMHTGLTTRKLYQKAYKALTSHWLEELDSLKLTKGKIVTPLNKVVTNYEFPHYLEDNTIVAIKSSYNEIPKLVTIEDKKEKQLTSLGFLSQTYLSHNNGKLAWTEFQRDIRRGNTNYSNVVTYDIKKNQKIRLTKKTKLFSPHFSKDGKKIVAVNSGKNVKHNLVILNSKSGEVLKKIENPLNDFLSFPKWSRNDRKIIYLAKGNSKLAFFQYDITTSKSSRISNWTAHTLSAFDVSSGFIYYTASYSGINNAYRLKIVDGSIEQISSVKNAMKTPVVSDKKGKILYSNFTEKGYHLEELSLSEGVSQKIKITEPIQQKRYQIETSDFEFDILDTIPKLNYSEKKYSGFFKGLKLHSWGFGIGNSLNPLQGLNLNFQNLLSDFSANIFVAQNTNEDTFNVFSQAKYSKYFVEFNLGSAYQKRSYISINNMFRGVTAFTENTYEAGFSVPLAKVQNNYSQSLFLETNYAYHKSSRLSLSGNLTNTYLDFGSLESSLTLTNLKRTALQNLGPKFGQQIAVTYNKALGNISAEKISLEGSLFLPGILKNHSTRIDLGWQKQLLNSDYQYGDRFIYARGYNVYLHNDEVLKASFNYQFPLFYPDFGFAGLVYCKRIRANLFYDYNNIKRNRDEVYANEDGSSFVLTKNTSRNSQGVEILFDTTLFNILPSAIGFRNSILSNTDPFFTDRKKYNFEIILQLNL